MTQSGDLPTDIAMLQTEQGSDGALVLDEMDTASLVNCIVQSQIQALQETAAASEAMAQAVDAAASVLSQSRHGRLIMVGAGASGRIAVQDGAELWPTFGWPHERLVLRIAGGDVALLRSVEGAEDDRQLAEAEVEQHKVTAQDVVLGIAASGRSPYTVNWVERAREAGALTIAFSNNERAPLLDAAKHSVTLNSGAEVLAGSTRLAAGTAQKAALNAFSTALMVRLNHTWGNLMVDMAAKNVKLGARRRSMLKAIHPQLSESQADAALDAADGWVKLASIISCGLSKAEALALLEKHQGSLRLALQSLDTTTFDLRNV